MGLYQIPRKAYEESTPSIHMFESTKTFNLKCDYIFAFKQAIKLIYSSLNKVTTTNSSVEFRYGIMMLIFNPIISSKF